MNKKDVILVADSPKVKIPSTIILFILFYHPYYYIFLLSFLIYYPILEIVLQF
jgi:hypothetical protein